MHCTLSKASIQPNQGCTTGYSLVGILEGAQSVSGIRSNASKEFAIIFSIFISIIIMPYLLILSYMCIHSYKKEGITLTLHSSGVARPMNMVGHEYDKRSLK